MPKIMKLECPVCGGRLEIGNDHCDYCGSAIYIMADAPRLNLTDLNNAVIQEHIAGFRQRVRSDPNDEEAHFGLGVAYFSLGLYEESIQELKHAAGLIPESPDIQAQLCVVTYLAEKQKNVSVENLRKTVNPYIRKTLLLDPNNIDANLVDVELLNSEQKFSEALTTLQKIASRDPDRINPKIRQAESDLAASENAAKAARKQKEDSSIALIKSCMDNKNWAGAYGTIHQLRYEDEQIALQAAQLYMRRHHRLLPRRIKAGSSGKIRSKSTASVIKTLFAFVKGLVVGVAQLMFVFYGLTIDRYVKIPTTPIPYKDIPAFIDVSVSRIYPDHTRYIFILSLLFSLLVPLFFAWRYRRKHTTLFNPINIGSSTEKRISKSDIMSGRATPEAIFSAAGLIDQQLDHWYRGGRIRYYRGRN